MSELDGQQSLFNPGRGPGAGRGDGPSGREPVSRPSHRRPAEPRSHHATPVGVGRCCSCGERMFLYRKREGLRAWVQPDLVDTCPECGLAITTTTVRIHKQWEAA